MPVTTTASIESAVSVRWRFEHVAYARSDLVRVRDCDGVTLAVLANGGESGFDTFWLRGSRLLHDEFERAWDLSNGGHGTRLEQAFARASAAFREKAHSLVPADADAPGHFAYGTLLAAAIAGSRVEIAWVGGATAVLVRGGTVEAFTRPHTLLERLREEGIGPASTDSAAPGILLRSIGRTSEDDGAPDRASFEMLPGDTLVLLSSGGDLWKPPVAAEAVAARVAGESDLRAAAAAAAEAAFTNGQPPFVAAAALRRG